MATFVVEGGISVGKSSLMRNVEKILASEYKLFPALYLEPVQSWTQTREGNLLSLLGDSPKKYGFLAQALVMSTLALQRRHVYYHTTIIPDYRDSLNILERSLRSSKNVFQKTLSDSEMLGCLEVDVLEKIYEALTDRRDIRERFDEPTAIIYLKTSSDVAWERCQKRGFVSDKKIKREYFDKIMENYDLYIEKEIEMGTNVLILDGTKKQMTLAFKTAKFIHDLYMKYY